MPIVPAGVKVHQALGYTDMWKGMDGLAMLVQKVLIDGELHFGRRAAVSKLTSVKS